MSPSTPGDAALSVSVSPPQSAEELAPVPAPSVLGQGDDQVLLGQEQRPLQASAPPPVADPHHAPGGVRLPASGERQQQARAGVQSTPTATAAPVPSTEKYVTPDLNDKWPGGPPPPPSPPAASITTPASASSTSAVPRRPNGPSLLTQQLAEARGIPPPPSVTGQSLDPSHSSHRLQQHLSSDPSAGSRSNQDLGDPSSGTRTQKTTDDPPAHHQHDDQEDDGDSLTPRASPRAIAMATTAAVSTISLPSRAVDTVLSRTIDSSDIRDVTPRPGNPRERLRPAAGDRGASLERIDRDVQQLRGLGFVSRTYSDTSATAQTPAATTTSERDPTQTNGRADLGTAVAAATEARSPTRPRKPDHRLSMGPEKAWSIGSEDLNNAQDGQVEKAIAEVLAGVEPNARSRKASHSLRFFKEGLPEEKLKRRDSRLGPRDKLSTTGDVFYDEPAHGDDQTKSLQPSPHPAGEVPGRLKRTRTLPLSPAAIEAQQQQQPQNGGKEPLDYFQIRVEHREHDGSPPLPPPSSSPPPRFERPSRTPRSPGTESCTPLRRDEDRHEGLSDAAVEDGELSGEEKISSAVFVPHKGPQGVSEGSDESEADSHIPAKQPPRGDHPSSWLVKADEPEADGPATSPEPQAEDQAAKADDQNFGHGHPVMGEEPQRQPMAEPLSAASVDHDAAARGEAQTQPSQVVSPGYGDHVHDHQLGANETLDAIELVPYRHQVGGHTTLWRFSKRAVCKQLNNRENEFYEQIEKHHRDLLPFLPRYIGVLNVTFSKQPRRKSTVKKDINAPPDRKKMEQPEQGTTETSAPPAQDVPAPNKTENVSQSNAQPRLISQSMQSVPEPIPTVTFLDNQHILPRSLLQPAVKTAYYLDRVRSSSVSLPPSHQLHNGSDSSDVPARPTLEDRHANSWGTTVVNKKLRHEVFSDAFLKQPINVQRHKRAYQRTLPRKALDRIARPASSDASLSRAEHGPGQLSQLGGSSTLQSRLHQKTQSDLGLSPAPCETNGGDPNDVTGTSAPEPDILSEVMTPQRRKRRHSGSALRRRPKDVSDARGDLRYWEEPDEAGYKGDHEDVSEPPPQTGETGPAPPAQSFNGAAEPKDVELSAAPPDYPSSVPSLATSPTSEFKRIPRPVNPKEAQTQRDSRVSYFLLLEDLTAGMKKPCIMDLKMGTRQYGVEASLKKQKSQQRKCAQTTSRGLGVRVCGLQVWDAKTEQYVFRDKYYGRSLKAGEEFQEALTRFLYDGNDRASILRHIPTILQKLSKLEVIARRLRGYRFYAASLLVTYDGDQSGQDNYDTAIEDSTTDVATDTEDANHVRKRKNKGEIDFKIADFANSLTPQDLASDKPCPPQHPDEPDRGFLKGLRSLRRYFLKIQQDTRAELGLPAAQRDLVYDAQMDVSDDEPVSE